MSEYGKGYFAWRDQNIDETEWHDILKILREKFPDARKVLEVGCGTGNLMMFLSQHGYDVTGVDISSYAVEVCRKRGLKAILSDAENLPFPQSSFDVVISQHLLEHLANPIRGIRESVRVSRGGCIHIVPGHWSKDPTHIVNHFTRPFLEDLLRLISYEAPIKSYEILLDSVSRMDVTLTDYIIIIYKL